MINRVDDAPKGDDQAPLAILDPQMGVELTFGDREIWRTALSPN